MKSLQVSTEFQHKSNGKEYYKVYVSRPDGSMIPGSRTINAFTGSALKKVIRETQKDINKGAYSQGRFYR